MPVRFGLAAMGSVNPVTTAVTTTDRGTGANSNSELSTVIQPTTGFAAGSTGILCIHADNGNGITRQMPQTSITDSAGNVWYNRNSQPVPGGTGTGNSIESAVYVGILTNGLTTAQNITVTYSPNAITAKAWTLSEVAPGTSGNIVIAKGTGSTGSVGTSTTGTITSAIVMPGEVVIGTAGAEIEDTFTADSDTSNGTWSIKQSIGTGSGITGMSTISQYKIQTTTISGQTYDVTLTSADRALQIMNLQEVPPKTRLTLGPSTSDSTTTVTFQNPIASGSLAVLIWGGDNSGTLGAVGNLPASLTDSRSNTWTLRQNAVYAPVAAANSGTEVGIYTSVLSTGIQVGDTVAITYVVAAVLAKCYVVLEFSDATAYNAGGTGTGSNTTTPSVTTSSITSGHYVVAMCSAEGNAAFSGFTADSGVSNGSWSAAIMQHSGNAAGSTVATMEMIVQYKKVTGTGTQTFSPLINGGTASDQITGWVDLTA